jgi:hypothetical protein
MSILVGAEMPRRRQPASQRLDVSPISINRRIAAEKLGTGLCETRQASINSNSSLLKPINFWIGWDSRRPITVMWKRLR